MYGVGTPSRYLCVSYRLSRLWRRTSRSCLSSCQLEVAAILHRNRQLCLWSWLYGNRYASRIKLVITLHVHLYTLQYDRLPYTKRMLTIITIRISTFGYRMMYCNSFCLQAASAHCAQRCLTASRLLLRLPRYTALLLRKRGALVNMCYSSS